MTSIMTPARQHYEFRVAGELRDDWYDWSNGLEVVAQDGITFIRGRLADQAALYGIIARFAALGLTLLSVQSTETTPQNTAPEP